MAISEHPQVEIDADLADMAGLRAKLRAQLIATGYPAGDSDEVIDLACHASSSALASMQRVIDSAGNPFSALTIAGLAACITSFQLEMIQASLRELADRLGLSGTVIGITTGTDA